MTLNEKLILMAQNTTKLFNAGYNKCLKDNITDPLQEIIALQEEYIYPKITFTFKGEEHTVLEENAYWNDKLLFSNENNESFNITDYNGYAQWIYYFIEDSHGNLIKYNEPIKDNESYWACTISEITIQADDGNSYLIKNDTLFWYNAITIMIEYEADSRFYYENPDIVQSDVLFKPEEDGPIYRILHEDAADTPIGTIVNATLVEGGNE